MYYKQYKGEDFKESFITLPTNIKSTTNRQNNTNQNIPNKDELNQDNENLATFGGRKLEKNDFEFQNPRFQILYEKIVQIINSNTQVYDQLNSSLDIQNEIDLQLQGYGKKLLELKNFWLNSQVEVIFKR